MTVLGTPQIICVTVYMPPKKNALFIQEVFINFVQLLRIILAGDFNLHIDNLLDPLSTYLFKNVLYGL